MKPVCVLLVFAALGSAACKADETDRLEFNYEKHFAGNDPNNPTIRRYATGVLTVTRPSLGSTIAAGTPFPAKFAIKMTASPTVVTGEWDMANHARTVYSFATNESGSRWVTLNQNRPDRFVRHFPGSGQTGTWEWTEQVNLGRTNGATRETEVEMYVSCCACNPQLQIPPPGSTANLRVAIKIQWGTDGNGQVTSSQVADFQVEQSSGLYSNTPRYPSRRDGGHACQVDNLSSAPTTVSQGDLGSNAQGVCYPTYCWQNGSCRRPCCGRGRRR